MAGKGDTNRRYKIHGDGMESIWRGFSELRMPEHRRPEAFDIVREVLAANRVTDFRWYKSDGKNELACYWDDMPRNVLWVTMGVVFVLNDSRVEQPERPINWNKRGGADVGWQLQDR